MLYPQHPSREDTRVANLGQQRCVKMAWKSMTCVVSRVSSNSKISKQTYLCARDDFGVLLCTVVPEPVVGSATEGGETDVLHCLP